MKAAMIIGVIWFILMVYIFPVWGYRRTTIGKIIHKIRRLNLEGYTILPTLIPWVHYWRGGWDVSVRYNRWKRRGLIIYKDDGYVWEYPFHIDNENKAHYPSGRAAWFFGVWPSNP